MLVIVSTIQGTIKFFNMKTQDSFSVKMKVPIVKFDVVAFSPTSQNTVNN